ncbi:MAG: hypothetical protein ABW019_08080 [Chitinophagaceae bacterium]
MPVKKKYTTSTAGLAFPGLAVLFLLFIIILTTPVQAQTGTENQQEKRYTVANVREDSTHITVVFLESARFYKLMKGNECYDKYLPILKEAEKKKKTVAISLAGPDSDVIMKVKP